MRRCGDPVRSSCVASSSAGRACGGSRSFAASRSRGPKNGGDISMNTGLKTAWASSLTAMVLGLGASLLSVTPAAADVAVRCGPYGCDEIHCNYTGDHCYRLGNGTGYGFRARYSYGYGRYY